MGSIFNDILGRAEKLSSINYQEQIGVEAGASHDYRSSWMSSQTLDNDLRSIFRASESLWNNAKSRSLQKDILFGEKGVVFGVKAPELDQSVLPAMSTEEDEEFEKDVDRVKLDAERAFFNHVLLSKPQTTLNPVRRSQRDETITNVTQPLVSEAITNRRELLLGDKIRKYIKSEKKRDLAELLNSVNSDPNTDTAFVSIWAEATAMINQKIAADRDDLQTCVQLINKACVYLQTQYATYMGEMVERNRVMAERGGVPGIASLVAAFMKISPDNPDAEDGAHNGLPVWELAFHSLRAGDLKAIKPALAQLQSFPQCAVLVQALDHLTKYETLDIEVKKKLKVEWRHNQSITRDKFKRGLYVAFLGGDSILADTMENWLWFKLITLKTDHQVSPALYTDLQRTVSIDYGVDYFMKDGDYQFFFPALMLSGQFERAINVLANCGLLCEAVHLAILASEMGYLRHSKNTATDLLTIDPSQPTKTYLNLPRLIVVYTKNFELTDPARAMDYCFLLRGFKTPSGSDVFEKAVSRIVYLMEDREFTNKLVGYLDDQGKRKPGLIDEYLEDPTSVIETVAHDTELNGQHEDAIYIYILAKKPDRAVKMLSNAISEGLRINLNKAKRLRDAAHQCENLLATADAKNFASLANLVDIVKIFEACELGQVAKAFKWSRDLRLIPTVSDAVPVIIREFHMVPQEVREVIPDLCLTMMKALVEYLKHQNDSAYVEQVKALVLYAAMVPYKFPSHISSDLLKLQASVAI